MDVSKLDYNFLEIFSYHYRTICDVYKNIDEKSPRELKKIRKWVEKTDFEHIYEEGPGGHEWKFWDKHIEKAIEYFLKG